MRHTKVSYGLDGQYSLPVEIMEKGDPSNNRAGLLSEILKRDGYFVMNQIIAPELCSEVIAAFKKEVKPFEGPLYRQISMRHVPHKLRNGLMTNAFLAIQDMHEFPEFRRQALEVIASPLAQMIIGQAIGYKPKCVETTFWESSLMGTPLHCDGDYINSIGRAVLLGAWFALEDIDPEAGRFVVVPGSHREENWGPAKDLFIEYRDRDKSATGSTRGDLKRRIDQGSLLHRALIDSGLPIIAPVLNKGAAIFWDSAVVHGTLPPAEGTSRTRYSLAGHYIPDDDALMMHGRLVEHETQTHNRMLFRSNAYPSGQ